MKKKTVITTEKLEIWVIPQTSEVAGVAPSSGTDSRESASGNESLTPLPEDHPNKNAPQTHED